MTEQHNRHTSPSSKSSVHSDDPTDADSGQEESASSKSNKGKTKTKGASKKHLSHDHFDFMLDWLERSGNYARVFGASGKTTIGGKDNKSANVAIEEWASHVSKAGSFQLTGVNLKARFLLYLGKYKEIKRNEQATGYGLSQDDYNNKIRTLAQKYEKECHAFERMDRIFGNKPNIHALASMEGGLATTLRIQGALVDIDLIDDDDEGTIFDQTDDLGLSVDDDGVSLQVQDRIIAGENVPLEETAWVDDQVAALVERAKRAATAQVENERDK